MQRVPSFKLPPKIAETLPPSHTRKRSTNPHSASHATYGMNNHFLVMRKESHLNSCFNVRKTKLKEITK
jgi:hypothetical protein